MLLDTWFGLSWTLRSAVLLKPGQAVRQHERKKRSHGQLFGNVNYLDFSKRLDTEASETEQALLAWPEAFYRPLPPAQKSVL